MTLQTIKSLDGKDEYVLLPIAVYQSLQDLIAREMAEGSQAGGTPSLQDEIARERDEDAAYLPFALEDYVDNPIALARMKAHVTQQELARRLDVTQAYISKVEHLEKVTPRLLERVMTALAQHASKTTNT